MAAATLAALALAFSPSPLAPPALGGRGGSTLRALRLAEGDGAKLFKGLADGAKGVLGGMADRVMDEASKGAMQGEGLPQTAEGSIGDDTASQLPASFEESVSTAVRCVSEAIADGNDQLVVEMDTSAGDETYTSLSRTMKLVEPFIPQFIATLAPAAAEPVVAEPAADDADADADAGAAAAAAAAADAAADAAAEPPAPLLQLLFPDEGTAAYVRKKWEGLDPRVSCASMPRARLENGVEAVLMVAPGATEVSSVQRLLNEISEIAPATLVILFNPTLVDMQSTGYGLVGRELRTMVTETFATCFALKTYPDGALYRAYPSGWSVWRDDAASAAGGGSGYSLAWVGAKRPAGEQLDEILYPQADEPAGGGMLDGLSKFMKGFQAM